jgi:hypothetical protein
MSETPQMDDAEREAILLEEISKIKISIYGGSSAPIDVGTSRALAALIRDFNMSTEQLIKKLYPPVGKIDKLERAVHIINSALQEAGHSERITKKDFHLDI